MNTRHIKQRFADVRNYALKNGVVAMVGAQVLGYNPLSIGARAFTGGLIIGAFSNLGSFLRDQTQINRAPAAESADPWSLALLSFSFIGTSVLNGTLGWAIFRSISDMSLEEISEAMTLASVLVLATEYYLAKTEKRRSNNQDASILQILKTNLAKWAPLDHLPPEVNPHMDNKLKLV